MKEVIGNQRRMVFKEESPLSPFNLFKMDAQEALESLWYLACLADFFFISCFIILMVRFFSTFSFTFLLLVRVMKAALLIYFISPL